MRFALIAGEASGDLLGAELIDALRQRDPQARFIGVAGPRMRAAGCVALAEVDALSVMGLAEVLPRLPSILRLRRRLFRQLLAAKVDAIIGIDAPDFNLPLERRLRQAGRRTVHVVSPSVWAWRPGRVDTITEAVDLMLCLLPFEPAFYRSRVHRHGFEAAFIGHPLAETLAHPIAKAQARARLGLPETASVLAVLPGSRSGELKYLAGPFAAAAGRLAAKNPDLKMVVPLASPALRPTMQAAIDRAAPAAAWSLIDGQAELAMRAADVVLLASGTATLQCLLLDRPMVVAYRVAPLTAWLLRTFGMIKIKRYSLPNLLCDAPVVPEYIQEQVTVGGLADAVASLLTNASARDAQTRSFAMVRETLRQDAAAKAAAAICRLCGRRVDTRDGI